MTALPAHRLRPGPRGWIVERRTASGRWARPTYHGDLAAALRVVQDEEVRASGATTVGELLAAIERAELTVTRAALAMEMNGKRRAEDG